MDDQTKAALKADRGALVAALTEGGVKWKGSNCTCPFHDDEHPSAAVGQYEGIWLFRCHVCKMSLDVIGVKARLANRPAGDVLREMDGHGPADGPAPKPERVFATIEELVKSVNAYSSVANVHCYTHPESRAVEMVVLRCQTSEGCKTFLQAKPVVGGFVMKSPGKPWPIYNRCRVGQAERVIVVEGEKCVEALTKVLPQGYAATTSPGGAGKGQYADWSPLAGKEVYLWPDNDAPDPKTLKATGIEHMRQVSEALGHLSPPPMQRWIDPELLGLPAKGDCVEWLELYGGERPGEAVMCALLLAQGIGPAASLKAVLDDQINGKRIAIDWPWPVIGAKTRALAPGTLTMIGGDPGSSKSLFLLECMAHWHESGIRVALYELEDEKAFHLSRLLAQKAGCNGLMDDSWLRANPERAREQFETHRAAIDSFGHRVYEAPDKAPSLGELRDWVRAQCAAGCRIVAIDPVTAAAAGDQTWKEDLNFLMETKSIIRSYGASLILVTHPKGGPAKFGGGRMAGGESYTRFSHVILWLQRYKQTKNVRVRKIGLDGNGYDEDAKMNRSISIKKTRNGVGQGTAVAYTFEWSTLRFIEHGTVVKEGSEEEIP